jgi:hypothetical protein
MKARFPTATHMKPQYQVRVDATECSLRHCMSCARVESHNEVSMRSLSRSGFPLVGFLRVNDLFRLRVLSLGGQCHCGRGGHVYL